MAKKKTTKKKKAKLETKGEALPLRPDRQLRGITRGKLEVLEMTEENIKKLASLPPYQSIERKISAKRIRDIKKMIDDDLYHAFHWVQLYVNETGECFSGNGQHTRYLFSKWPEYIEGDMQILLETIYCETLADAALMYTGYDSKRSVRSPQDEVKAVTGADDTLAKTDIQLRQMAASIRYMVRENGYKFTSKYGGLLPSERADRYRKDDVFKEFTEYMDQFLHTNSSRAKKLLKLPVLYALYLIWDAVMDPSKDLTPFIVEMRDGGVTYDEPTPRWWEWMKEHVPSTSSSMSPEEMEGRRKRVHVSVLTYYTIETWNRWCKREKTRISPRSPAYDIKKLIPKIRKGRLFRRA